MPIDPRFVGKRYGPFRYEIGLEKMREFALAVGGGVPSPSFGSIPDDLNPLFYDESAGKRGPFGSVIAFPTFAVTFAIAPFAAAVSDPELQVNLLMVVHGEQQFEFFGPMRPGEVVTTTGWISEIFEKSQKDFLVVVSEAKNQKDELLVRATWTAVIRR